MSMAIFKFANCLFTRGYSKRTIQWQIASGRLTAIEHGPVEIASVYQEGFSSDRSVEIVLKSSPDDPTMIKQPPKRGWQKWLPRPEKCCQSQICFMIFYGVFCKSFSQKVFLMQICSYSTCECVWFLLVMNSCICELCDDYYMCIYPLDPSGTFHIAIMHKFPKVGVR